MIYPNLFYSATTGPNDSVIKQLIDILSQNDTEDEIHDVSFLFFFFNILYVKPV